MLVIQRLNWLFESCNTQFLMFLMVIFPNLSRSKTFEYSSHSPHRMEDIIIVTIVVFGMAFVVFISCCLSKSMRNLHLHLVRRITVMTAQYHSQGSQYSPYPANNLHPVYGLQPIPIGPTLGQQYAPGPPSTYLEAGQFPAPFSQAAYDEDQIMYALQPALLTDHTSPLPPHNPDYLDSPESTLKPHHHTHTHTHTQNGVINSGLWKVLHSHASSTDSEKIVLRMKVLLLQFILYLLCELFFPLQS
ncbi:uncharacterized protein LOC109093036 isoform X3 [Cyprinus carpio]|uniref:Uncharacterized protein LOC109093036 isoform X3 n=1 Tax=Cyprinus carpio TaxID=7962 RepID=A0A9Q9ZPG8_CYPCA|nr:uncharacterized protein LOC109093036 isoform X3 [Cyprinus carpio]